jgi:hypothetical protein
MRRISGELQMASWFYSLSLGSMEKLNNLLQICTVLFGLGTVIAGALIWITGSRIDGLKTALAEKERQASASTLSGLQHELATSREEQVALEGAAKEHANAAKAAATAAEADRRAQALLNAATTTAAKVAQESAAVASQEAEAMREQRRPRHLTPDARNAAIGILTAGPTGPLDVIRVTSDQETAEFSNEVIALLRSAGWAPNVTTVGMMVPNYAGLVLNVANTDAPPPHAIVLQRALESAGFSALAYPFQRLAPNGVRLVIGHKPGPQDRR